jgi:hypothetical protein
MQGVVMGPVYGAETIGGPDTRAGDSRGLKALYDGGMWNPFVITGALSIALWITIREPAFEADPLLAWVATVVLLGWGAYGLSSTLRKKPNQD